MTTSQAQLILTAASVQLAVDKRVHDGTLELCWQIPTDAIIAVAEDANIWKPVRRAARKLYDTRMAYARAEMIRG